MHLKLGEVSTIVVSSPEYAKEVMKTHDHIFASRPYVLAAEIMDYDFKGVAFTPYGDYWRQLRKIFALELLSSKRVQSFQPIREEVLTSFIKRMATIEGSQVNITKEVISTVFTITARTALGSKSRHHQKLISVVTEAAKISGGFDLGDLYPSVKFLQHMSGLKPKLEKLHQQADQIMQNIINEHREAKSSATGDQGEEEVLLDVLLKKEFGLSDESIKAVIWVRIDIFHQFYCMIEKWRIKYALMPSHFSFKNYFVFSKMISNHFVIQNLIGFANCFEYKCLKRKEKYKQLRTYFLILFF